jgi:hypothetical protein
MCRSREYSEETHNAQNGQGSGWWLEEEEEEEKEEEATPCRTSTIVGCR